MKRRLLISCLFLPLLAFGQNVTNRYLGLPMYQGMPLTTTPGAGAGGTVISNDIVVYGATSGGMMAAVQAARLGKNVTVINPGNHLGGMTGGGLESADIGTFGSSYIQGLAGEFYSRNGVKYSQAGAYFTTEPHMAEQILRDMMTNSTGTITIYSNQYVTSLAKTGSNIFTLTTISNTYSAKEFVDASYEGDLLSLAGCSNTIGREGTNQFNETWAGVQTPTILSNVDPYAIMGNSGSGLIPNVSAASAETAGNGDGLTMAYNFRLCFGIGGNALAFYAPTNYQATNYDVLVRYLNSVTSPTLATGAVSASGAKQQERRQ